jgi:hypothetical protein
MAMYSRREVQPAVRVEYFLPNPTDIDEVDKAVKAAYAERGAMQFVKVHATEDEIILSFEKQKLSP